jgi:hypothetical protein
MATRLSDETPGDNNAQKPPLSRRDFLKIAGREAADTGAKVIPGASLARAAVETPWWKRVVSWRNERAAEHTGAPEQPASALPTSPEETSDTKEPSHGSE